MSIERQNIDLVDLAWLAPLNRGGLNSTHFHGTHVPVEEPSTASIVDTAI